MSYLTKLMEEAKPKAEAIKNTTHNVVDNIGDSIITKVAINTMHRVAVNTIGLPMALAQPTTVKLREMFLKAAKKVEVLAADPKSSK